MPSENEKEKPLPTDTKTIPIALSECAPAVSPSFGTSTITSDQYKHHEKVTLETLGRQLGLSAATISKALSGKGRISEKTRLKIRQLADDLGYVPNIMARNLQREASDTVGLLLLGDITNQWYSKIVSFLSERLEELGRTMMFSVCSGNPMRLRHAVASFIGGNVQGIIAGPVTADATMEQFRPVLARHLPIVFFGNLRPLPQNFVTPDQEYGGYLVADNDANYVSWNHIMQAEYDMDLRTMMCPSSLAGKGTPNVNYIGGQSYTEYLGHYCSNLHGIGLIAGGRRVSTSNSYIFYPGTGNIKSPSDKVVRFDTEYLAACIWDLSYDTMMSRVYVTRHGYKTNATFADGHAAPIPGSPSDWTTNAEKIFTNLK